MKTPLLVVSLLTAAAAGFIGGMYYQQSLEHPVPRAVEETAAAAKPAEKHRARTKFQVLSTSTPPIFAAETPSQDLQWLERQRKILESDAVRLLVVKQQNLALRWGVDENAAASRLQRMTEVSVDNGTDILSVAVWANDPQEAAALANATRTAYEEYRLEMERERFARLAKTVTTQIKAQEEEVERRRAEMEELAKKHKITADGKRAYEMVLNSIKEYAARQDEPVARKPVQLIEEARAPQP
jgi:hypothetical protein